MPWFIKAIEPQEDGSEIIVCEIHNPCCYGKIFKYEHRTDGKIYYEFIEVGQGVYDGIKAARTEYARQSDKRI